LPGIQAKMMMITSGGNKCGLIAILLHQLEAQQVAVEIQRSVEVGYLEVYMADAGVGGDLIIFHKQIAQYIFSGQVSDRKITKRL